LTCRAEPVTVKACANEDCSDLYPDDVSLRLLPNNNSETYWMGGGNVRTFSGGEATFLLRQTFEGDVSVGLANSTPAASGVTRCVRAGQEGSCVIDFADVGLEIDPIPTQIANRPSIEGGNSAPRIRVLRTDDETRACIPALSGQTLPVDFAYLNPEPSQALGDNLIAVDAVSSASLTAVNQPESVDLSFDTEGAATFNFTSQDAGRHQLRIRLDIPVPDGQGGATAETLTRTTTSNAFIVRPLAVFADASGNPQATGPGDNIFRAAGDDFDLGFSAIGWGSSLDGNGDGQWDACGNPALGDPGIRVRVPQWNLGRPAATLIAPAGGQHQDLGFSGDVQISRGSGQTIVDSRYSEVGIIQVDESIEFLGETLKVCSPNIGRFIPARFVLSDGELTNRAGLAGCTSDFTYIGERFDTRFTLTAQAAGGGTTMNYEGAFAFLDSGELNLSGDPALSVTAPDIAWMMGSGTATAELSVARSAPEGPYVDYAVTTSPVDDDGVSLQAVPQEIGTTDLYFGRAVIDSAIGSELGPLELPWKVERWEAGTWWTHAPDSCTEVLPDGHITLENEVGVTVTGGEEIDVSASGGPTSIEIANSDTEVVSGRAYLHFTAPMAPGWVDVFLNLDTDWPFLRPDLDDDGVFDDNPSARASFGLFEGSPNRIFLREVMPR
jgi:MSHA biogenesis protein MshQ